PAEVRTCWICQQDDTEDTPENNVWRTPCPCSLTAHDSCLLEWIANEEAPKPGELAHNHKIVCPQCQAQINIQRPRDYLVAVVENIQWAAKWAMVPAATSATIGFAYSGLLVYGMNAMTLVFGAEETQEILRNGFREADPGPMGPYLPLIRSGLRVMDPFLPVMENSNPTLYYAVPLIAPALILFRTKVADYGLSILLIYLINPTHRTITWPPTPGLTLATLPYIRSLYNTLYSTLFARLETSWDLAVQRAPRAGETAEQIFAQNRADAQNADDGGARAIFELEWVEEPLPNPDPNPNPPQIDGQENEGVAPQPNDPNPNGQIRNQNLAIQRDIDLPTLATRVLGALFFPAISSVMGTLLKYALPNSLIAPATVSRGFWKTEVVYRGLLREKWGRSIVGGCLFVVLKDAVVLYCKWKKARDFGKRRVLDFVGKG
ncbi:uncharacterized protein LY89DRAFT_536616, partial [Mollisia scopiformis]